MNRAIVTIRQFGLLLGDTGIFFLALALAVRIRQETGASFTFGEHLPAFAIVFVLWLVTFYVYGLYELTLGRNRIALLGHLGTALLIAAAEAIAFFYLVPSVGIAPKTTLFIDLILTATLLVAWRLLSQRVLASNRFRSRILFVGLSDEANELIAHLEKNPHLGLDVTGAVVPGGKENATIPIHPTLDDFPEHLKRERADTVVLSLSPRSSSELAHKLYESIFLKTRFVDLIGFYEQITRRIPVSAITHVWFLENLQESTKEIYEGTKRGIDILGSLLLGLVTFTLFPVIALAMYLSDPGTILFSQERLGKNGKKFRIRKFRTMVADAEKDGARFAEKGDVRVTPIGRVLRMTRLDELPQFWNVLVGEMSFIGPRPERPELAEKITQDMAYYPMRLLVRPGLSGWAQVNHSYYATPEEHRLKLQYDLYYIKNRSFALDTIIALRTLNTVLRARGQ